MTYVKSFIDVVPSPRFDSIPWHHVDIQEAPLKTGPWVTLETQLLTPIDTDPEHPEAREITTHLAQQANGWYRFIFYDSTGNDQLPTSPISYEQSGEASFLPTVQQVALFNRSRTKDSFGNETGTFSADTKPTDTEILQLIPIAAQRVADVVGDDIPEALWDDAASVIALRAAMQVELDYYPDQVNTGRSIYPQLEAMFKEDLKNLQTAVTNAESGDGSVVNSGPGMGALYSFPASQNWMERTW